MKANNLFILASYWSFYSCSEKPNNTLLESSGNPIFEGWYANPEGAVFGNEFLIYTMTFSGVESLSIQ